MNMDLGTRISELRREKGMTQEQLAKLVGISAPAVSKWETGSSCPDIALLCPLARALDTNVDTLLQFEEELSQERLDEYLNEILEKGRTGNRKKRRQCCRNSFIRILPAAPLNTMPLRY